MGREAIYKSSDWDYIFEKDEKGYILSVVCGSAGIYTVDVRLTPQEAESLLTDQTQFKAKTLAGEIRSNQQTYASREVKNEQTMVK